MAGKKPLKMSEIPGLEPEHREGSRQGKRRRHRDRSYSPAYRSTRRSSPSYAPYDSEYALLRYLLPTLYVTPVLITV